MTQHWLNDLNPAQREVVLHEGGPLLVIAGAGTGKTKTLACRVAHLISQGVPAERILLLTFTRRAAGEMLKRAASLLGHGSAGKVWGGTFHAISNRLLRIYGRAINLGPDFTVMDEGDSCDLFGLIRTDLRVADGDRRFPRKETLRAIYSRTINANDKLKNVLRRFFPWCADDFEDIRRTFEEYTVRKRDRHLLDYDDLLLYWKLLAGMPDMGRVIEERFDHILVDEYQDTNALQADILIGMRRTRREIMVVGDDAQSIYSFRAATVRNMFDFSVHFPDARQVTLDQNYRSTQPILDASNAVMEQARERFTKNLWSNRASDRKPTLQTCEDENAQSAAVIANVLAHLELGIPLMKQGVLFRAGWHSDHLEAELISRKIPFVKYGGLKFLEMAHVKDLLAFLRILENPHDELSWFRVLKLLPGIGGRAADRIMNELGVRQPRDAEGAADAATTSALATPIRRLIDQPPEVSAAARKEFENLRGALADCLGVGAPARREVGKSRARRLSATADPKLAAAPELDGVALAPLPQASAIAGEQRTHDAAHEWKPDADEPITADPLPLAAQIERIRVFYEPLFQKAYDNASMRARDLDSLQKVSTNYESRRRFVTELTLDPPVSTSDLAGAPYLEEDYLILSTIHSAKGCEWDVVHVLHAADGMIPSDMALSENEGLEEERRLLYVAMTRARDMLHIYFPLRYYHRNTGLGDRHSYAQLTRFLTADVQSHFARLLLPSPSADPDSQLGPRDYVDSQLSELWRD